MNKILIKDAIIVTMKEDNQILHGDILIEDDIIKEIAEEINIKDVDRIIDSKGKIVMPGLINCHTQVGKTLFRGFFDDYRNDETKEKLLKECEEKLLPDDIYVSSMLAFIEMIKSGTTCFNDNYFMEEHTIRAANQAGIRGFVAYNIKDDDKDYLSNSKNLIEYCNENASKVKVNVGISNALNTSPETISKAVKLSKMQNMIINADILETKKEAQEMYYRDGKKIIDYYAEAGLFDVKTVLNHGTWLDEYDLSELVLHDTSIVNCPISNAMQGSGIADIRFLLDSNVNIALGTDSIEKCGSLDMFAEIKHAAYSQKVLYKDAKAMDAEEVLRMATINGAKALGIDDKVGTIEEGKKADLIIVDINKIHLVPFEKIYNTLAYHTNGSDVVTTIVDGKIVMFERKFVNINEDEVIDKAIELGQKIS